MPCRYKYSMNPTMTANPLLSSHQTGLLLHHSLYIPPLPTHYTHSGVSFQLLL